LQEKIRYLLKFVVVLAQGESKIVINKSPPLFCTQMCLINLIKSDQSGKSE